MGIGILGNLSSLGHVCGVFATMICNGKSTINGTGDWDSYPGYFAPVCAVLALAGFYHPVF